MSIKVERKTNIHLKDVINDLLERSRDSQGIFWRDIASRLNASRNHYAAVNLGKLDRFTEDGETIVIPGTLLSSGVLHKKIKISALKISERARSKLSESGSEFIELMELAKENPKGTDLKIIK
ncbi:MAG: 50S ribosomal protein L18e [Ferroplasma sp.]